MAKSIFIVFDGLDGSGKSLMLTKLHNYLFEDKRIKIVSTREPTYGMYGKKIREILKKDTKPFDKGERLLDLFLKDRAEHVAAVVKPFLSSVSGDDIHVVLCDRYYYSTIAFQATQGIDIRELVEKNKDFPSPDATFILNINPQRALERMRGRTKEKFENMDFMQILQRNFLQLPSLLTDTIYVIDAEQSKDSVFSAIKKEVEKLI